MFIVIFLMKNIYYKISPVWELRIRLKSFRSFFFWGILAVQDEGIFSRESLNPFLAILLR